MPTYIHMIPFAQVQSAGTDLVFQASVQREGRMFVSRTLDAATGRVHERYFTSLPEFVSWHYKVLGYEVAEEEELIDELYRVD